MRAELEAARVELGRVSEELATSRRREEELRRREERRDIYDRAFDDFVRPFHADLGPLGLTQWASSPRGTPHGRRRGRRRGTADGSTLPTMPRAGPGRRTDRRSSRRRTSVERRTSCHPDRAFFRPPRQLVLRARPTTLARSPSVGPAYRGTAGSRQRGSPASVTRRPRHQGFPTSPGSARSPVSVSPVHTARDARDQRVRPHDAVVAVDDRSPS